MFLKIMNDDGLADNDYRKRYHMIEVVDFFVYHSLSSGTVESQPSVTYTDTLGKEHSRVVHGNVYVMNNQGKTIDTWSPNKV